MLAKRKKVKLAATGREATGGSRARRLPPAPQPPARVMECVKTTPCNQPPSHPGVSDPVSRALTNSTAGVYKGRTEGGDPVCGSQRTHAPSPPSAPTQVISVNDPSAGSPTDTLLRLLLPLDDEVCSTSHA